MHAFVHSLFVFREGGKRREGWGKRRGRGRDEILSSVESDVGSDLTTPRSQPQPKSTVGCLTDLATQVPLIVNPFTFSKWDVAGVNSSTHS